MKAKEQRSTESGIYPVQVLQQHIVALDAAMLVAANAAEAGPVHKLRTGTRRVEAQIELLHLLEGGEEAATLPAHHKEAAAVRKRLRRVRRAAGKLRDLDVQMDAIEKDAPEKAAVHKGTPGDAALHEANQLRKHLKHARAIKADKLIRVLKKEDQVLAAALRALEQKLEPSLTLAVTEADLAARVRAWFGSEVGRALHLKARQGQTPKAALRLALERLDEDSLHGLRKSAKLCRYMGEAGPEESGLQQMAQQFEAVQEAGGTWHDWYMLADLARGFHGRKADLTLRYERRCTAELANYRLRLTESLPMLIGSDQVAGGK